MFTSREIATTNGTVILRLFSLIQKCFFNLFFILCLGLFNSLKYSYAFTLTVFIYCRIAICTFYQEMSTTFLKLNRHLVLNRLLRSLQVTSAIKLTDVDADVDHVID